MPRRILLSLAAGLMMAGLAWPVEAEHGLVPTARQTAGPYDLNVFTEPSPPRAGPVEVSVLVQRAGTTVSVNDARVIVTATPAKESDRASQAIRTEATRAGTTNKLFYAATFRLPAAGRWRMGVAVTGPLGAGAVAFEVEAAETTLLDRPLPIIAGAVLLVVAVVWWRGGSGRKRAARGTPE